MASAEETPAVTVAVVSWNTRGLLDRCLASLRSDHQAGRAEVWVVDNASTDGSAEMVATTHPWARLIRSAENLGYGPAVNHVAERTTSTWIAAANADLEFEPGALAALVAAGAAHPDAGIVAPRLILAGGTTQHSAYAFPTIPFTAAYVSGVVKLVPAAARHWRHGTGFDPEQPQTIPWAVGALLLVRRSVWDQIGGFDERQWMYAEDLDLGWRVRQAGWSTWYEPTARVHHNESSATSQAWGDERYGRWHRSTYAWILRRRGAPAARAVAAINVGGFAARAAFHALRAAAGRPGAREQRADAVSAARAHLVGLRSRRALESVR